MPTFKLKDGFSFNADITPATGALFKYFQSLPNMTVSDINLTNPPATSAEGGLSFSNPVNLGKGVPELTINAGLCGKVNIFVPKSEGAPLFDPDDFGDNVRVPLSQRYVSVNLTADLEGSASVSPGDLKFGFDAKNSVEIGFYRQLDAQTPLGDALVNTISNFFIPADLDDIAQLPENSIATVESTGQLSFSGSANLLSITNPLATFALPQVVGTGPQIAGGVSVTVGASYTFSGEYQVRVHRLLGNKFRLGFYRKRDSQFKFDVDAKASISANFENKDLFSELMNTISSAPGDKDLQALKASGLPDDRIAAIKQAILNACNRSLEIGIGLELSREHESKAIFLYQVDLSALDDDARQRLHLALVGDLTGVVDIDPDSPPAGITVVKTLISKKRTLQHSFKLNLLGIYNVQDISTLIIQGIFFDQNGAVMPAQLYTNVGLLAIETIVSDGDPEDYRLKLVRDSSLFNDLVQIGAVSSTAFRQRCQQVHIPDAGVPIVGADLQNVLGFTKAMVTAGQRLQDIDNFIKSNPNVDPNNHDFRDKKQKLSDAMADVVVNSNVDFGGPWGFAAMAMLGKAGTKKWFLVNKFVTNELSIGQPQPQAAQLAAGAAAGKP